MTRAPAKVELREWLDGHTRLFVPTRRVRFALALRALDRFAGGRRLKVLDAGCSEGLLAEQIALRHPDWSIDAVDIDEGVLEQGRAWARKSGIENIEFFQADLTQPLGKAVYDAVLAVECLTLIPDDGAALSGMAAALRQPGLFIAHVPDRSWTPILRGSREIWRGEERHGYSQDEIVGKIEDAGLTIVSVTPTSRTMARVGRELSERVEGRSLKLRAAWYPVSVAMAHLERWGLTWGSVGAYFVEARN